MRGVLSFFNFYRLFYFLALIYITFIYFFKVKKSKERYLCIQITFFLKEFIVYTYDGLDP